jgi:hypothetical protein
MRARLSTKTSNPARSSPARASGDMPLLLGSDPEGRFCPLLRFTFVTI